MTTTELEDDVSALLQAMGGSAPPRCDTRCHRMTARGLCDWCARRAGREVADLASLWPALWKRLEPRGGGLGAGRGTEMSIGVRLEVLSFVGPIAGTADKGGENRPDPGDPREKGGPMQVGSPSLLDTLVEWCRLVAEERGVDEPNRVFGELRGFLARHHDWIVRQPWADDYAEEIHKAWSTAMTLTSRWESAQPQTGRYCPWCNAGALYQQPGMDEYECQERAGGCGRQMTRDEYDQMVGMRAHFERQARKTGVA